MMSISERDRQTLDSIESELGRSTPRLASMLVMFSRLTADEQMPAREPVRSVPGKRGDLHWVRRFRGGRKTRGWLCLAVAAALLGLMIIVTHGIRVSPCTHSFAIACTQAPAVSPASVQNGRR